VFTAEAREHLKKKFMEFSKSMYDREVEQASLQVREPRTEEEQMRASDLLSLVLEFDDEVRGGDCKKLSS